MADFFDSKAFNPEVFARYMGAIENPRINALVKSRAINRNDGLKNFFGLEQVGSVYGTRPYFGLLGGKSLNYDGTNDLETDSTKSLVQGVFALGRWSGWHELDFSSDVTGGEDFMQNIRNQIIEFWNAEDQGILLSILKGVFAMNSSAANKKFVKNHTTDISAAKEDVATEEEHLLGATTLNSAMQKASGDQKQRYGLVLMHSAVATHLENLRLLEFMKYTDENNMLRDATLATWNGRTVLIDDSVPAEEVKLTGNTFTKYTTYILGDNAITYEPIHVKTPFEMERCATEKGGIDRLIVRRRHGIAVKGISYLKKSQETNSPTNEELEKGTNWSLISNNDGSVTIDQKLVPIARIISRG